MIFLNKFRMWTCGLAALVGPFCVITAPTGMWRAIDVACFFLNVWGFFYGRRIVRSEAR